MIWICRVGWPPPRTGKRLRRRHVAVLAEHHVHQRAGAVDGAVEMAPAPADLQVRLIDVPAPARLATRAPPRGWTRGRGRGTSRAGPTGRACRAGARAPRALAPAATGRSRSRVEASPGEQGVARDRR